MNTKKIYEMTKNISFCAQLNLLFVVGVLMGFVFLGVMPSLQAAHHVSKLQHQQQLNKISKTFFSYYFKIFWQANLIGIPIFIFYFFPFLYIVEKKIEVLSTILLIVLLISFLMMTMGLITSFAMVEYYNLPLYLYFIQSVRFILYRPISCLLSLLFFLAAISLIYLFPGVTLIIFGLWIHLNMGLYLHFFEENEKKVNYSNEIMD